MKRIYNHHTHAYEYRPVSYKVIDQLASMKGAHNDKIADAQPAGLFVWLLMAFVAFAIYSKAAPAPEPEPTICIMGLCL